MTKILIVDDHTAFRKGLNLMLQELPGAIEITEAATGEEFLNIINESFPDLVLMDIRLPGINGIEAAYQAIKQYPHIRIIVLTMYGEDKYLKDAIEAGAKSFLVKPPTLLQLKEAYYHVMNDELYFPLFMIS